VEGGKDTQCSVARFHLSCAWNFVWECEKIVD